MLLLHLSEVLVHPAKKKKHDPQGSILGQLILSNDQILHLILGLHEDPRLDAVFDHWRELIDPGYFLEDHASFSWQDAQAPQINGEAAMYLIGNFYVPTLESAGVVDKMDFFQFPTIYKGVGVAEDAPTDTIHILSLIHI